jgi:hypothetical protein
MEFASADVSANPVWVEIDLGAGADADIDAVRLFPRTDTLAVGGGTAGFPVDFTLQTSADGAGTYTTVRTVTAAPNLNGPVQTYGFRTTTARHVRLQATGLGAPAANEASCARLGVALWAESGTEMAYRLFCTRKTTGARRTPAMPSDSWKSPSLVAPSPTSARATVSVPPLGGGRPS